MFKKADFVLLGLVLATATATYVLKYGSEIENSKNAKLAREIELEKEAIDILKADWSLLTNPARIQVLGERYKSELNLEVLEPQQIITIDQIPVIVRERSDELRADSDSAKTGIGDLITGSIKSGNEQ